MARNWIATSAFCVADSLFSDGFGVFGVRGFEVLCFVVRGLGLEVSWFRGSGSWFGVWGLSFRGFAVRVRGLRFTIICRTNNNRMNRGFMVSFFKYMLLERHKSFILD
jgi:hypothetical protein